MKALIAALIGLIFAVSGAFGQDRVIVGGITNSTVAYTNTTGRAWLRTVMGWGATTSSVNAITLKQPDNHLALALPITLLSSNLMYYSSETMPIMPMEDRAILTLTWPATMVQSNHYIIVTSPDL